MALRKGQTNSGSFKKGHVPWIKGKVGPMKGKKFTKEHRKKISKSSIGKRMSLEVRKKISIANKGNKAHLGKHHSKETKIRISKKLKELYKRGEKKLSGAVVNRRYQVFPVKDTSIEIKIQGFLKKLGIEFHPHQYMDIKHGYQCDAFIPSLMTVIECDGDYWHNYPIGRPIDHIRTRELTKKGFRVIRLWERQIRPMTMGNLEEILGGEKFGKVQSVFRKNRNASGWS